MSAPTIDAYSDTSITVSWTALTSPDNGNSDILAYELVWDKGLGTSTFETLSNVLSTAYVVSGITAGTTYQFKVRARNIYGSATDYSSVASATAIAPPDKLDIPSVEIDTTDATAVLISWDEPLSDHGSDVD
jgi:hypothetical protein